MAIEGAKTLFFFFLSIGKKQNATTKNQKQKTKQLKQQKQKKKKQSQRSYFLNFFISIRKKQKATKNKQSKRKELKRLFKSKLVMLDSCANCLISLNVEKK